MIRQNSAFVLRNVADIYILVACKKNNKNKWMISLNSTAAYIWNQVAGEGKEKDKLLEELANNYQISNESPECDAINKFINQLIEYGIFLEVDEDD